MRWLLPLSIFVLAGCGSSWQIRKGSELEIGCVQRAWYPDADGDGWGDPTATPTAACEPPEALGRSAPNGRDCDDGTPLLTGRTGATCPDGLLAASGPISYGGALHGPSEYVFVFGDQTPTARFSAAESGCAAWSGADRVEEEWVPRGGLAVLDDQAERVALQRGIEEALGEGEAWAGFVGLGWQGDLISGEWAWIDAAGAPTPGLGDWCDGEPLPEDFFPGLDPAHPERLDAIEDVLGSLRLALVRTDEGRWCFGLPEEAGTTYTRTEAHLLCERPAPDPGPYEEIAGSSGEG